MPEIIIGNILRFEQSGVTSCECVKKMQAEWQTVAGPDQTISSGTDGSGLHLLAKASLSHFMGSL